MIKLTEIEVVEIEKFIIYNGYSFRFEFLFEEYEKYKNFEYVSHSYKKVFEKFSTIFKRDLNAKP